jgi:hypothetical protein
MAAGRSLVFGMMVARIERAQAQQRLIDKPPLDIALTLAALAQGLVSMQRAGRFSGEDEFNASYRTVVGQALSGFILDGWFASDAHAQQEQG